MGLIYRPNTEPKADIDMFSSTLLDIMDIINTENKLGVIMGDMIIDLLKFGSNTKTSDKLKRAMKIKYFRNSLEENKHNIKKTWSILKQAIGKLNNKSSFPHTFLVNDIPITDKLQAAEGFNTYFSKIGEQTSESVRQSNKSFRDYMPRSVSNSMFIEPVLLSEVLLIANKLKPKLSYGHDDISTKLLKQTIYNIILPITHIINRSFDTDIVPNEMKIAKVIPIYKSSDPSLLKNYRPVSLLTAFSKLIEKLIFNKLISFLNFNNTLFKHQYGFRSTL